MFHIWESRQTTKYPKPLILKAFIRPEFKGSRSNPAGVTDKKLIRNGGLFVFNGGDIWISDYTEFEKHKENGIRGLVRNGPKWGPNLTVHVVCEFELHNQTHRIMAKSQNIFTTF